MAVRAHDDDVRALDGVDARTLSYLARGGSAAAEEALRRRFTRDLSPPPPSDTALGFVIALTVAGLVAASGVALWLCW